MSRLNIIFMLVLLSWLTHLGSAASEQGDESDNYVREACSVTRYQDLCVHSLALFSSTAKSSPSKWARAGVSVTLSEAKRVAKYLNILQKSGRIRGRRNRVALSDCVECFEDATDDLHRSLGILRNLNAHGFDAQMSDLTTSMSACLTYQDTCLDGFDGERGKQAKLLRNRVMIVTYFTSNALALVNKLASTGLPMAP